MRNDTVGHLATTHEMAFSAVCEIPKNTNSSQWNEDNTWNLYFRLPYNKQYNSVNSAVLRLYMNGINSTGTRNLRESDNCKNPADQMIRITASVYYRKNRKDNTSMERKKRICSSITITQSYRGWISMDTLLAVKLWDKPKSNFGIAIDVEDLDDRPLRAADFFQPTDCSEASRTNAPAPRSSKAHGTAKPWRLGTGHAIPVGCRVYLRQRVSTEAELVWARVEIIDRQTEIVPNGEHDTDAFLRRIIPTFVYAYWLAMLARAPNINCASRRIADLIKPYASGVE
ncbi:hypothetical protein ZHAS_00011703 [Anopheles sinensis]|uniref:TGF-beta propeptide domain-containing protein n=1 Tax=Anopheles sinensis TaxID=74873 RepID=A0A084W0V9_ANOSI|nr:hypothetical protein ZHAS_00011703 [Anopheles sinensis]